MSFSFLASIAANDTGSGTGFTTSSIDTAGATLLVAAVAVYDGGNGATKNYPTFSDSKGNTWHRLTSVISANHPIALFFSRPSSVGTGHTFTVAGSGGTTVYPSAVIFAFASASTPALDGVTSNATGGTVTTLSAGSLTPSGDGSLVLTAVNAAGGNTLSATGMTATLTRNYAAGTSVASGLAYLIQTTAAASNPAWSWTSGGPASAINVAFREVGGSSAAETQYIF